MHPERVVQHQQVGEGSALGKLLWLTSTIAHTPEDRIYSSRWCGVFFVVVAFFFFLHLNADGT